LVLAGGSRCLAPGGGRLKTRGVIPGQGDIESGAQVGEATDIADTLMTAKEVVALLLGLRGLLHLVRKTTGG
jgi:hypothetical protein